MIRGIRGAIDVEKDEKQYIYAATQRMLKEIIKINELDHADIISAVFTATTDLKAAYPAAAAREIGWDNIPMLCTQEMDVVNSLARCIRVLLLVDKKEKIRHVYLGKAQNLRPDLKTEE